MKILYNKVDKKEITSLPRVLFGGRIFTIQTEREADKAVDYLRSFKMLGIDTETKPSFKKGKVNSVALLQVSTEDTCFLFRLNRIGMPLSVVDLLEDQNVMKVGLSLKDDFASLRKRADVEPKNVVELQDFVKKMGIEDMSLQKIYANLFREKISKGQRLTNWEADILTDGQKLYAATDAWACVRIYTELMNLRQRQDFEIVMRTDLMSKP